MVMASITASTARPMPIAVDAAAVDASSSAMKWRATSCLMAW
jgi:hypothetical protein